jgi:excinuclease ABC subunit C
MKEFLATLPSLSGVYLFKDVDQQIIYIGKAKDLKKRVSSYFQKKDGDWKIESLLEETVIIDHIVTKNEQEALLLEAELVQDYQPKFNVLLKSGNPFLYLIITKDKLPQLKIVRNKKTTGTRFGPFIHKQHARRVHDFIVTTFRLYTCNKKIENGCLDYHLGKCAGTCKSSFDPQEYLFKIELAKDALRKNHKSFLKKIQEQIKEHNTALEFEKAKHLNDYKENFKNIFSTLASRFNPHNYLTEVLISTTQFKEPENYPEAAQKLKEMLHLDSTPDTIDCFDISHFQSSYIVGSCVRFTSGKPDKNNFRRFKIQSLEEQNDYAALQEIVARRYRDEDNLPDLVLIDGGKGQRSAVVPLLPNTPCVSLAKREELLFSDYHKEGIALDVQTPVGKLLLSLRDYAHHFAITYHRKLRHKNKER